MISWIQATFQHHFKLVFAVLLFAMVIPLIFIYSASGGLGRGDRQGRELKLFGVHYSTKEDQRALAEDGQLSLFLSSGQMFFSPEQSERHAFSRAAAIAKANELGIPQPTDKQIVAFIQTLPVFFGEDGKFDAQQYQRFLDTTKGNPQFSQGRISRVLAENWRAQQATRAIAGPGFAIDPEVRTQIAAADTTWTVYQATLPTKDIKPAGEPSEAELQQWFDNNAARYRLPPQIQTSAVEFPAQRFLAQVQATPPNDDDIVKYFEGHKETYRAQPAATKEGEQPVVAPEPKLEDVRDRVIQDLTNQRATMAATKAASDFAYTLFDKKITRGTPAFDNLLSQQGLTLRPMPPLALTREAANYPLTREAASLSDDKPVSDPIVAGPAAVILFFDGRIEASDATLSAVRDRVVADVKEDRRIRAVVARGEEIRAKLAAAVKDGKSFVDAAKSAGLEAKAWENFTRRKLPEDFDRSLMARMVEQPTGEVSPMTLQGDTGSFIFVAQRREPVINSDDPNYAEARRAVMADTSRLTAQVALSKLVQDELLAAGLIRSTDATAQ